jgi:hypothetical protein
LVTTRRVWGYQRGNRNPYIEEEQTTQWPKEKVQKDKQRSTKHTHKTKDRVPKTPLKTGGELMCSGRVSSFCSTSGTRRINLVTNPVISHEWGKFWSLVTTRNFCSVVYINYSWFVLWEWISQSNLSSKTNTEIWDCIAKSLSSKTYQQWYTYRGFGEMTSVASF